MAQKKSKSSTSLRIVNRRAWHEYHILEKLEVALVLRGSEIKSIRNGQVSLTQGYARIEPSDGGLYLYDVDIALYSHAGPTNQHEPKRPRKLLAHKRQIKQLMEKNQDRGTTLIPLAIYFVRGLAKLELAVAQGKKSYDKRQNLKTKEADRDMRRAMTRKRL